MKWDNSLMAFEEDIKNRSFIDWIKSHTSFMKPLHRYEGIFEVNDDTIEFLGEDVKEKKDYTFRIKTADIEDVKYGYDDVFTGWEDRAAPWNKPLKICFKSNNNKKCIYLFVSFHRKKVMRSSENEKVCHQIKSVIE